jgi:hypothetical protein
MWISIRLCALALMAIGWPSAVPAEEPSPQPAFEADPSDESPRVSILDANDVRITGCEAFPAESIRRALRRDIVHQLAARPSADLLGLVNSLRSRVIEGYQAAGYLDIEAQAGYDPAAGVLTLQVQEGPQVLADGIQVVGAKEVDAGELARRLQRATPPRAWKYIQSNAETLKVSADDGDKPAWTPGEKAQWGAAGARSLTDQVRRQLADLGFPFAKFEVECRRSAEGSEASLVIKIVNEGQPATLRTLRTTGLTRHTEEQLQEFLALREGSPINSKEVDRVREALRQSCRFWKYDVKVILSDAPHHRYEAGAQAVDLSVDVVEYDLVPMLGEPLSDVDASLAKVAEWLESFQRGEVEGEISLSGSSAKFGAIRSVLSPRHGAAIRLTFDDQGLSYNLDMGLIESPQRIELFDWRTGKKIRSSLGVRPSLNLSLLPAGVEDGRYVTSMKMGIGASGGGDGKQAKPLWAITADPVATVHASHREGADAKIADGILTLTTTNGTYRFRAATGALIDGRIHGEESVTIELTHDEFDRLSTAIETEGVGLVQVYNPVAPWQTLGAFTAATLEIQPFVAKHPHAAAACKLARKLLDDEPSTLPVDEFLAAAGLASKSDMRFSIPSGVAFSPGELSSYGEWMFYFVPGLADALFPPASAPWTISREWAFSKLRPPIADTFRENAGSEISRLLANPDTGPLSALVAMQYAASVAEASPAPLVRLTLATLGMREIENDVELLVEGDHGLALLTRALVRHCDSLEPLEQATIVAAMPLEWRSTLEKLFERRRRKPEESPEDALRATLVDVWRGPLRTGVEAELAALLPAPRDSESERQAAEQVEAEIKDRVRRKVETMAQAKLDEVKQQLEAMRARRGEDQADVGAPMTR